jgi:hypothetical protein
MLEYIVKVADRTGTKFWKLTEPHSVDITTDVTRLVKHEVLHMEQCLLDRIRKHGQEGTSL